MTASLTLVNHACVLIETEDGLLLCDPWMEGTAFNNGWALLDRSTSNDALIGRIRDTGKPVCIWYSHEHPDHFSIGFLRALKNSNLQRTHIVFQETLDKRVIGQLKKWGLEATEAKPGVPHRIGDRLSITTWPFFDSGDSFAHIDIGGVGVLNVNDCIVDSAEKCRHIKSCLQQKTKRNVDILLTQFGYANWIGNEDDIELRRTAASEKLERIALQVDVLAPKLIIPFASFVYFCHVENAYLNDAQNSVDRLLSDPLLPSTLRDRVCVMKPGDRIALDTVPEARHLAEQTAAAVGHWKTLTANVEVTHRLERSVSRESIAKEAAAFQSTMNRNFARLNVLLEFMHVIRPISVRLEDLDLCFEFSFTNGLRPIESRPTDMSCTAEVFEFILKNDFGFNTTIVNGRFRTNDMSAYRRVWRFFILQDLKKMGFGVDAPVKTLLLAARNARKFLVRR